MQYLGLKLKDKSISVNFNTLNILTRKSFKSLINKCHIGRGLRAYLQAQVKMLPTMDPFYLRYIYYIFPRETRLFVRASLVFLIVFCVCNCV